MVQDSEGGVLPIHRFKIAEDAFDSAESGFQARVLIAYAIVQPQIQRSGGYSPEGDVEVSNDKMLRHSHLLLFEKPASAFLE